MRDVCNRCSHVHYTNPRVVVGALPIDDADQVDLVQKDGEWTLPYDFMHVGETSKQAASRLSPDNYTAGHLLAFDEMPESGIVTMTFRVRAQRPAGTMFPMEKAIELLSHNPAALHAIGVYARTRHLDRLSPGFLGHCFDSAARPVLDMLHVSPATPNPASRPCGDCDFDKGPTVKIVAGVVGTHDQKILLAQRAIAPRIGFWTLPAGFMEIGETMREGAAREAKEETGADVEVNELLAVYEIPAGGQVMPIFRGTLKSPDLCAGEESQAVGLFTWDEVAEKEKMDLLAFPMVKEALNKYHRYRAAAEIYPCHMLLHRVGPGQPPKPGSVL